MKLKVLPKVFSDPDGEKEKQQPSTIVILSLVDYNTIELTIQYTFILDIIVDPEIVCRRPRRVFVVPLP